MSNNKLHWKQYSNVFNFQIVRTQLLRKFNLPNDIGYVIKKILLDFEDNKIRNWRTYFNWDNHILMEDINEANYWEISGMLPEYYHGYVNHQLIEVHPEFINHSLYKYFNIIHLGSISYKVYIYSRLNRNRKPIITQ